MQGALCTWEEYERTTMGALSIQGALCTWEDVKMRVPPLAPTNLGRGCNIIKVEVINELIMTIE